MANGDIVFFFFFYLQIFERREQVHEFKEKSSSGHL